jgi:uncharacterized protein
MILVDTGPLLALFDPADPWHGRTLASFKKIDQPLITTVPVLTEAFHLLTPASIGAHKLMEFIHTGGLSVWFLVDNLLVRAFELMHQYADREMDLADASLVVAAETLRTRKVFSVDRNDFLSYRIRRGYRFISFELLGP